VGALEVPAWVVDADLTVQSKIFIALNATTTKVPSMQLWHSRLAARDPDARSLFEVCKKAGVKVSRYPVADIKRQPNVTMCPDIISKLRQAHGDRSIVSTLMLLRMIGEIAQAPLLVRRYIIPFHKLFLAGRWAANDLNALALLLSMFDFSQEIIAAQQVAKLKGASYIDCLVIRLLEFTRKLVVGK